MSKTKMVSPKVGDIVILDFSCVSKGSCRAKITAMSENSIGGTIITYERLDGTTPKFPLCNIGLVSEIVQAAPYRAAVKEPQNIFLNHRWHFSSCNGGHRTGLFVAMIEAALSTVRGIDLTTPVHCERAARLYEKASWPGRVSANVCGLPFEAELTVRWKVFQRWVHRNALRLVLSKSERRAQKLELKARLDADLMDALLQDEVAMEAREPLFGEDQDYLHRLADF
jgi:hypothetical protein